MFYTVGFFVELMILISICLVYWIRKRREVIQKWRAYDHKRLMTAETKLIEIAKWLEGEKIHHDPGRTEEEKNAFVLQWIFGHAADVRATWEKSRCRTCSKDCYCNLKKECPDYVSVQRFKHQLPIPSTAKAVDFLTEILPVPAHDGRALRPNCRA
jgi:hypothetical protein